MTPSSAYFVAGRDLEVFVSEWLTQVAIEGDEEWLSEAVAVIAEGDKGLENLSRAGNLAGPLWQRAMTADAPPEEVLLAAVLAVYAHDHESFRGMTWTSRRDHVVRAFRYARKIGDRGVARKLIHMVIERAEGDPERYDRSRSRFGQADLAAAAYWDEKYAELDQRELRAAALFDPSLDFDTYLLDRDQQD